MTLRIAIAGASGRMGQMLIEAVLSAHDMQLVGALDAPRSANLGKNPAQFTETTPQLVITDDVDSALADAQVLIDFTRPTATLRHIAACVDKSVALVIGTTGLDEHQKAAITQASQQIGVVFSPNMSIGVNVTFKLLEIAAKILAQDYDIEIIEAHHRHKIDAPSGTAIKMGEVIATVLERNLEQVALYGRQGITGERDPATIGFSTIRGGDIVGDHTVLFAGAGERVEITHKASSRVIYAQGSLRAARFLATRAPGLYDMHDVLGLK